MMIWQGSEQLLREFVTILNTNNFNLSFTMNSDSSKLEFLDIKIKKDHHGLVSTNLFQKKTASNSLLHAKSMHPFKCIEGIPKGQYIRLRRICSSDEDFKYEAYKLCQRFKMRGYKSLSLRRAYQWALSQNREDLLYKPTKPKFNKIGTKNQGQTRLILIYNDNDGDIRNIIHKHWEILSNDPTLSQLVTPRPLFTYKKNTSIGDLLTQSHFQKQSNKSCCKTLGGFRCGACEQWGRHLIFTQWRLCLRLIAENGLCLQLNMSALMLMIEMHTSKDCYPFKDFNKTCASHAREGSRDDTLKIRPLFHSRPLDKAVVGSETVVEVGAAFWEKEPLSKDLW
ncbi:hypothetical protein XELAEV_18029173mg [Xenopus laevis]|uniref:Helix-turn-helix domain-containing protein n=1 Tax=Xenopus laevis TaxID=8355 RepID=A0A974CQV8_XENLA|nr:hypothetical protein XELAEV_18029173mg [Xenopus laevis]